MNRSTGTSLNAIEGQYLVALDALLGAGRGDALVTPVRLNPVRRELLEAGRDRIARTVMRHLVEGGGFRARTLLRDGARTQGRAWDAALGAGFTPRYTAASLSLWLESARELPEFVAQPGRAAPTSLDDAERKVKKSLRTMIETEGTDTGDWVLYHLALRNLPTWRLPPLIAVHLARRLRAGSPYATLHATDDDRGVADLPAFFDALVAPRAVRIVECCEDRLTRTWTTQVGSLWRSRADAGVLTAQWSALGRTMQSWAAALDGRGRLDLAGSILRTLQWSVATVFSGGGEAVRQSLGEVLGLRTVQTREGLLRAAGSVVEVGVWLLRRRDELAAERYGDARYEEAQRYLRVVDDTLGPMRRGVEGLARALSGAIG